MKGILRWIIILCSCVCLCSCTEKVDNPESKSYTFDEILWPSADGVNVDGNQTVQIDYSNIAQGYFMVETLTEDHNRIKIQVIKDTEQYTYDLNKNKVYEVFPLNMGNGSYCVKVLENVSDDQYGVLFTCSFDVKLDSEFCPFLYPNQIVDYNKDTLCLQKSFALTKNDKTDLERVQHIFTWVVDTIAYDWDKVKEVQGKFVLPVLDTTYQEKKGICFDYASLMAAMLRVQHIPTKVVTGMVEDGYHAWIEVYIDNMGWIKPHIYFKRDEWTRMDPTYIAMNSEYDGKYIEKYTY